MGPKLGYTTPENKYASVEGRLQVRQVVEWSLSGPSSVKSAAEAAPPLVKMDTEYVQLVQEVQSIQNRTI